MFYVCVNTPKGYVTLSVFDDKKIAINHKLDWYWLNTQYQFKILTKCKDGAKDNLFTKPRKLNTTYFVYPGVEYPANQDTVKTKKKPVKDKPVVSKSKPYKPKHNFLGATNELPGFNTFTPEDEYTYPSRIPKRLQGFLLDEDKGLCYIYAIHCRYNGRIYVGKTKALYTRSYYHLSKLRRRSHDNQDLQTDFIRWKEHNFTMQIIDTCPESELAALEIEYIHKYAYRAYNVMSNPKKRRA
jgi:predicted GIY-YIG superfamily endonuclease